MPPPPVVGMIINTKAGDPRRLSRPEVALPAADPRRHNGRPGRARTAPTRKSHYPNVVDRLAVEKVRSIDETLIAIRGIFNSALLRQRAVSADREHIKQPPQPEMRRCSTQHGCPDYEFKPKARLARALVDLGPRQVLIPQVRSRHDASDSMVHHHARFIHSRPKDPIIVTWRLGELPLCPCKAGLS
jgi:hypothetical protein